MKDFLIVANGPFLSESIIEEAAHDRTIVSLDGATNKLAKMNILPKVILGDFDTIDEATRDKFGIMKTFSDLNESDQPYLGKFDIHIVPAKNQHITDLHKAIRYCDKIGAKSITIVNALGGRMDFHESNLGSLRAYYRTHRPITILTGLQTIRYCRDEAFTFRGLPGDKCGIFGFPAGSITTNGLKYETTNYVLKIGQSESACNSLRSTEATVHVTGEALLIMPPSLKSQREFLNFSEKEKLETLLRTIDR